MLKQQLKQRNQSGFTIIEVMIVLAIAGVIMMLVFLAIPALQRNNRNTQMRSDVSNLLGYVAEFSGNNNGAAPTTVNVNTATGDVEMCAGSGCTAAKVGSIRAGTTVNVQTSSWALPATGVTDTINLAVGVQCNATNDNIGAPTSRVVSALYRIETSGGDQPQCQQS